MPAPAKLREGGKKPRVSLELRPAGNHHDIPIFRDVQRPHHAMIDPPVRRGADRHQIRLNGLEDAGVPRFERLDEDRKFVDAVAEDIRVAVAAPVRLRHDVYFSPIRCRSKNFAMIGKSQRLVDDKNAFLSRPWAFQDEHSSPQQAGRSLKEPFGPRRG